MGALAFTRQPVIPATIAAFWIVRSNPDLRRVSRLPRRRKSRNEQLCSRTNDGAVVTSPFWTRLMSVSDLHKHHASRDGRCPRRVMKSSWKGRPAEAIRRS